MDKTQTAPAETSNSNDSSVKDKLEMVAAVYAATTAVLGFAKLMKDARKALREHNKEKVRTLMEQRDN